MVTSTHSSTANVSMDHTFFRRSLLVVSCLDQCFWASKFRICSPLLQVVLASVRHFLRPNPDTTADVPASVHPLVSFRMQKRASAVLRGAEVGTLQRPAAENCGAHLQSTSDAY